MKTRSITISNSCGFCPGTTVKCVNDEEMLERRIETNSDRRSCFDNDFNKIPLHCYLYMFHLELHQNIWVHVQNLEEYQYKPELRTKTGPSTGTPDTDRYP